MRQEETSPELRTRVFASFMASLTVVVPFSVLAAGLPVDVAGLTLGTATLAVAVVRSRAIRELEPARE